MAGLSGRINERLKLSGPPIGKDGVPDPDWQLDFLFAISATSWPIHICVTSLAAIVLVGSTDAQWPWWWLAVMIVLSLTMIGLGIGFGRRKGDDGASFGRAHTALVLMVGIAWGVGALLAARHDATTLTFYTLVLGGTALGAVSSQHVRLVSCMASIWTSIPLLALAYVTSDRIPAGFAAALMMLLFGVILSILALRMHHFLLQNTAIRTQLVDQVAKLTESARLLEEAHASKSRFIAQASHDLRQPIHAIGLFVECLGGLRIGGEGRAILRNIDLSVDSLARLCRSLLDLSALDVGKVKPQVDAVSLSAITGEVVRQAAETARANGVDLRHVPSRHWVETDGALLHTMVQNLVSNAVKYAPGSRVLVGVRRRGDALSIDVLDRGPGIAPENHRAIFQEFVQLREITGAGPEGLGLGLSIVERIAALLGLAVRLRSSPGRGAAFSIDGLRPTRQRARSAAPAVNRHQNRLRGMRILVVDDDARVLESTAQILSRWGCVVQAATSAAEARLHSTELDFLLCDHDLGDGLGGQSLVRELRGRAQRPLPAAIITGLDPGALEDVAGEGIIVMAKPVRPAQLRSALLAAIST